MNPRSNILPVQTRCVDYTGRVSQSMFDAVNRNNLSARFSSLTRNPLGDAPRLNPLAIAHLDEIEANNPQGQDGLVRNEQ